MLAGQRRTEKMAELRVIFYNRLVKKADPAAGRNQLPDNLEAADTDHARKRPDRVTLLGELAL